MTLTLEEQRERIAYALRDSKLLFSINAIPNGNDSYVELYCPYHDYHWKTKISNILSGHRCKLCGNEGHHLDVLLQNPKLYDSKRSFYWVKMRCRNNSTFWKYGVVTNNFKTRYSPGQLKKDGLEILGYEVTHSNSLTALMVEFYILHNEEFSRYRAYKHRVMSNVGGGSECFRKHVIEGKSYESLVKSAFSNWRSLLESLYKGEREPIDIATKYVEEWLSRNLPDLTGR